MGAISFTGLASGMDTSSWIEALVAIKQESVTTLSTKKSDVAKSQSVLNTVKSKVSSLRSSIEKLTDSKFGGSFDIFAKNTVSSSKPSIVSAVATNDAARQNLDIVVSKLATATTATSNLGSRGLIDADTEFDFLSSGNAKNGSLSIFVDGKKESITIEENEKLGSIIDKLNTIDGVNASLADGKITINGTDGKSVIVGAASDESNFASVTGLVRNSETGVYESYTGISKVGTSTKLTDVFGEDVKGTLTVGMQEFTIDENTTMSSFIAAINRSEDANATAYWDASAGEMVIKSKAEGAFNINIEAGTSTLTDKLGFTTSEEVDGVKISKLNAQKLGDYAELTVNGTNLVSSSNTVTSDISGIEGLTLTLKAVSKPDDEGVIEPATVSIEQDTNALKDAVKSFITAYNDSISSIDESSTYGNSLYGDSALTSLRNNLRKTATASLNSGTLKLLSDIGITTGNASNTTDTKSVNKLQLDESKFDEALAKNPDAVKKMLVGDNKGNSNSGGIFNKLENIVEDSLASSIGYFDTKAASFTKRTNDLNNSITREQSKVDSYKARLQKQFSSMESLISSIRSSYSNLTI